MSSSTYNLILLKSSFKNRNILLNNFKIKTFCYIIYKLRTNAYFTPLVCPMYLSWHWFYEILLEVLDYKKIIRAYLVGKLKLTF